ncbi:MAG: alpha/beta hydrolase, partial [Minicystis sp.]
MRSRFLWRTAVVAICLTSACSRRSEPPVALATAQPLPPAKVAPSGKHAPRPPRVNTVPDRPDLGPRLTFVQGPHGRLRLSDGGEGGVPVVFVHGLGGSYQAWSAQLEALRPARRAAALDLRGHGESDAPSNGDYAIPALADDVETVVSLLGFEKVYLVGHSMAGLVLASYAGRHPDKVAGMVFVDALGDLQRLSREEQEAFVAVGTDPKLDVRKLYEDICGQRARPETRVRVLEQLDEMKPGAFAALRKTMVEYS